MKSISRKRSLYAAAAALLTTGFAVGPVFADGVVIDGDAVAIIAPGNSYDLGDVCAGVSTTFNVPVHAERTNSDATSVNTFANSAVITLTETSSIATLTEAHFTLESDWVSRPVGYVSEGHGSLAVTFTPASGNSATGSIQVDGVGLSVTSTPTSIKTKSDGDGISFKYTGVTCPANTAPTVSVSGPLDGAAYDIGSVPSALCIVNDAEDADEAAIPAIDSSALDSDGLGSETVTCSYTDDGGLFDSDSVTYTIVDPTAPEISVVVSPADPDGESGWYRTDVSVTWTVTEAESPSSLVLTGCVDQTIVADQDATTYSCSVTSSGGLAGPVTVTIKRDSTDPTIEANLSGTVGNAGWYRSAVAVDYVCGDITSGVASCGPDETLSAEGANAYSGLAADVAGNESGAASGSVNIDTIAPTITWNGGPTDGGSYYFGSVPAGGSCSAADAGSGQNGCAVTGYATTVGAHTLRATATDVAGNSTMETRTYSVLAWRPAGFYQPVDMRTLEAPTVTNTVKLGSTVPLKWELFAGSTEITAASAIVGITTTKVTCSNNAMEDAIEEVVTTAAGQTVLRYDSTGGQYIYNWSTKGYVVNGCYRVTMTAQDGSSLTAFFKMK